MSGDDGTPDSKAVEQPEVGASVEPAGTQSAGTQSAGFEAAVALPQVLKIVGVVVAPTTLLTALMAYFGQIQAAAFWWYLGVQFTVLDLTIQDFLLISVDSLIIPLIVVMGAALVVLWFHQLLRGALPAGARRLMRRVLMPAMAVTGLILVSLVIADVFGYPAFATFLEGRGLSLSIGVLLLAFAARLLRLLIEERRPEQISRRAPGAVIVAEWGAVFVLVTVGLFWAAGSYAIGVGTLRAQQLETSLLPNYPDVVVYSEKSLSLQAPGVREATCQNPDAAYRFRYEGLKLVQRSGDQYLFLPAGWTRGLGAAILIPRSESLRLEFSARAQARSATC